MKDTNASPTDGDTRSSYQTTQYEKDPPLNRGSTPDSLRSTDSSGKLSLSKATFESFRSPTFRLFYAAMICQMAAMNMQMMARSWFTFDLTGSELSLGIMALANAIPMLAFSLFGGVIADRVQKKLVLIVGQSASAVVALAVAISISFGNITWVHLAVASLFQGLVMGLMMPSRQSIIPEIVGEEGLMNAVALNNAGMNVMRLMAPAFAGYLISMIGIEAVYYVMTGLYILAVLFILPMPPTGTISLKGGGALQDLILGLRYIKADQTVLLLLLVTFLGVLCSMPYMMLLPVFTTDVLGVGPSMMGVLISVSGIGSLAGSLALASVGNKNRGKMLIISMFILGFSLMGFAYSHWWYVSLAFVIPLGLGQAGRMTLGNALVQYYVREEYRGRVMSIYMMEFGITSFAVFFAALLSEVVGVQWVVGILALILVLITLYFAITSERLRQLD